MSTGAGNEGRGTFGLRYASFRPAEFSGTYYTTSECQGTAWRAVPQMFTRYLAACGHGVGPEAVRIDARYLSAGDDGLTDGERDLVPRMAGPSGAWGPKVMVMTTSVAVLAPVSAYPRCGNWLCRDDADRADADPVDEPAVYAGVSAEQHFVRQLLGPAAMLMMPRDLFGEMLADRRQQADGKPLWTIDVRPRAPERM